MKNLVRSSAAMLLLLFLHVGLAAAQDTLDYAQPRKPETPKRPLKDRLYFGGGLGLSFGTVTSINVEPFVGYKLDQAGKLSVGTGISYWYYKDNRYVPSYETNSYGYRFFSRYRVLQPVYLHAEYSSQNYEIFRFDGSVTREWVPMLLLGGGYVSQVGNSSAFYVQVLWDVIQDVRSPYGGQPFISVGVGIGF